MPNPSEIVPGKERVLDIDERVSAKRALVHRGGVRGPVDMHADRRAEILVAHGHEGGRLFDAAHVDGVVAVIQQRLTVGKGHGQTCGVHRKEIRAEGGDAASGGGLNVAEPVPELNPFYDFGQAVLAVEFAPFALRRHHQLERHGQPGLAAEASLGAFCAVPDGRKGALDRI